MLKNSTPYYFDCGPRSEFWAYAAVALLFALIGAGIFYGAIHWARAQAYGLAPVSICEVCGQDLNGTHGKCEAER